MEQLPTVGDVTVVREAAPEGFSDGFTWVVTFQTQIGNIELLNVDGNSTAIPIVGPAVQLTVVEVQRGISPSLHLDITELEPGATYATRISAENAAGYGPDTVTDSIDGFGISPASVVTRTVPPTPNIAGVTALSASQLAVTLEQLVESTGFDVVGYKVRSYFVSPDPRQCIG